MIHAKKIQIQTPLPSGEQDAAADLFAEAEKIGAPIFLRGLSNLRLTATDIKNGRRKL